MPTDGLPVAAVLGNITKKTLLDIQDIAPSLSRPKHIHVWDIWVLMSWIKNSSCVSTIFVFYSSKAEVLDINLFSPPLTQHEGGTRYNWVGDIRLHFQGVEGIEFPPFPHLRPTEARECGSYSYCQILLLSFPVLHAATVPFIPPFFYAQLHFLLFIRACCVSLLLSRLYRGLVQCSEGF